MSDLCLLNMKPSLPHIKGITTNLDHYVSCYNNLMTLKHHNITDSNKEQHHEVTDTKLANQSILGFNLL